MLFKFFIMFTVGAVTGVRATPSFDFPDVIHRDEIPAGITVHEYNATAAALGAAAAPELEPRKLLKERSDCHGSFWCKFLVDGRNCRLASDRFLEDNFYCGYTSYYVEHCAAIYRCYSGDYLPCVRGGYIKGMFQKIYDINGCKRCGTYDIPIDSELGCHVTYNYCDKCQEWVGQRNPT